MVETENPSRTGSAPNRDLAVLLTAKSISDIGYALDFICLSVFIWVRTGSTLDTGLVSVVLYTGSIVGGRLGHRYGDHWDRRKVMISADLVRMAMLATLAVLPGRAQTWWLYPAVAGVGTGRSVFEASLSAATPVLAGARTQSMNGILAGLKGVAFVIGMGLATVAVPVIGYRGVFACDAATYALSATVLLALRLRTREARPAGADADRDEPALWPQLVGAGLAALMVLRGLDAFASSSQQVGLPVLGSQLFPADPARVSGGVWGSWAAGLLIASFVLRPLSKRIISHSPKRVFCVATMVMSAGFIGVFWLSGWWPRLASAAIAGIGDALSEITFKQSLQSLPDHRRGRAFGLSQIAVNSGFMGGLLITSAVLRPAWLAQWVLLLHGVPLLLALWMAVVPGRTAAVAEPTA
ncbi:MAG TPA: MFS transporter [Streptosporangiaceae bacterium]|nr:MFS transporter [Streptosporangiaceae bacterium]